MAEDELEPSLRQHLYPELGNKIGVVVTVSSTFFFAVLNAAIRHVSQSFLTFKMMSEWRCRNLLISWIHAGMCSLGVIYCYLTYIEHVRSLSDMVDLRPYPAYVLTAFSTGYFLYDFLDHVIEGKALRLWEVSLHHIACIVIFGYNLVYHMAVGFSVLALMMEISSFFLHGRKLLQMAQLPFCHWLYCTTVSLNLVTFVLFRGAAIVMILIGLRYNFHRLSLVYSSALVLAVVYTFIMNPVLFWRLLKSDVLRKTRQQTANSHRIQNGGAGKHIVSAVAISESQTNAAYSKAKSS